MFTELRHEKPDEVATNVSTLSDTTKMVEDLGSEIKETIKDS